VAGIQFQSSAPEEQVRQAVADTLIQMEEFKPTVAANLPGSLVIETGSVGMAYVAGGFRKAEKMPMRITVTTTTGEGGTGIAVNAESRGTGGGFSGGLLGIRKQKKGEQYWLEAVRAAIPGRIQS